MNAPTANNKLGFFELAMLWLLGVAVAALILFAAGAAVGCFVVGFRMVTQ